MEYIRSLHNNYAMNREHFDGYRQHNIFKRRSFDFGDTYSVDTDRTPIYDRQNGHIWSYKDNNTGFWPTHYEHAYESVYQQYSGPYYTGYRYEPYRNEGHKTKYPYWKQRHPESMAQLKYFDKANRWRYGESPKCEKNFKVNGNIEQVVPISKTTIDNFSRKEKLNCETSPHKSGISVDASRPKTSYVANKACASSLASQSKDELQADESDSMSPKSKTDASAASIGHIPSATPKRLSAERAEELIKLKSQRSKSVETVRHLKGPITRSKSDHCSLWGMLPRSYRDYSVKVKKLKRNLAGKDSLLYQKYKVSPQKQRQHRRHVYDNHKKNYNEILDCKNDEVEMVPKEDGQSSIDDGDGKTELVVKSGKEKRKIMIFDNEKKADDGNSNNNIKHGIQIISSKDANLCVDWVHGSDKKIDTENNVQKQEPVSDHPSPLGERACINIRNVSKKEEIPLLEQNVMKSIKDETGRKNTNDSSGKKEQSHIKKIKRKQEFCEELIRQEKLYGQRQERQDKPRKEQRTARKAKTRDSAVVKSDVDSSATFNIENDNEKPNFANKHFEQTREGTNCEEISNLSHVIFSDLEGIQLKTESTNTVVTQNTKPMTVENTYAHQSDRSAHNKKHKANFSVQILSVQTLVAGGGAKPSIKLDTKQTNRNKQKYDSKDIRTTSLAKEVIELNNESSIPLCNLRNPKMPILTDDIVTDSSKNIEQDNSLFVEQQFSVNTTQLDTTKVNSQLMSINFTQSNTYSLQNALPVINDTFPCTDDSSVEDNSIPRDFRQLKAIRTSAVVEETMNDVAVLLVDMQNIPAMIKNYSKYFPSDSVNRQRTYYKEMLQRKLRDMTSNMGKFFSKSFWSDFDPAEYLRALDNRIQQTYCLKSTVLQLCVAAKCLFKNIEETCVNGDMIKNAFQLLECELRNQNHVDIQKHDISKNKPYKTLSCSGGTATSEYTFSSDLHTSNLSDSLIGPCILQYESKRPSLCDIVNDPHDFVQGGYPRCKTHTSTDLEQEQVLINFGSSMTHSEGTTPERKVQDRNSATQIESSQTYQDQHQSHFHDLEESVKVNATVISRHNSMESGSGIAGLSPIAAVDDVEHFKADVMEIDIKLESADIAGKWRYDEQEASLVDLATDCKENVKKEIVKTEDDVQFETVEYDLESDITGKTVESTDTVEICHLKYLNKICTCGQLAMQICLCRKAMYCSQKCQMEDWNNHKLQCQSESIV